MFLISFSRCLSLIHWNQMLSQEWRCIWAGAAPTTSKWSASVLPMKVHLILEVWWYLCSWVHHLRAMTVNGTFLLLWLAHPRSQNSWGQHGAHLGPVGPRWAPCWPHEPCYQGCYSSYLQQMNEITSQTNSPTGSRANLSITHCYSKVAISKHTVMHFQYVAF